MGNKEIDGVYENAYKKEKFSFFIRNDKKELWFHKKWITAETRIFITKSH